MPPMSIIDSKKGAFGPYFIFSMDRLCNVEDNWNPILVVVTYETLVCDGRVGSNDSVPLNGALSWLFIGYYNSCARLKSELLGISLFISRDFVDHLVDVESCELLDLLVESWSRILLYLLSNLMLALFEKCLHIKTKLPNELWCRATWR